MPVIVNDIEISDAEIYAEMQYHPAPSREDARHLAAQALVIRQLLLQAAVSSQLLSPDNECVDTGEQAIQALLSEQVSVPEADAETCYRYYQQNRERFIGFDENLEAGTADTVRSSVDSGDSISCGDGEKDSAKNKREAGVARSSIGADDSIDSDENLDSGEVKNKGEEGFEVVHARIRDYLVIRSLRMGVRQYIKHLCDNAKIIGLDMEQGTP